MLRRYPVVSYFVLTFAIAWSVWIPGGLLAPDTPAAVVLPGAWAPTISAVILTAIIQGRSGVRNLLRGVVKWRAAPHWYLLAILGGTAVALLAIGIHALLGGSTPTLDAVAARFGLPPERADYLLPMLPLLYLITVLTGGPIAEELGWRGYAQPRLQAAVGPAPAGAAIGLIWSLWHLPLFFFLPSATGNIPFLYYVPLVTAWGVLFGWVYHGTGGSVLLCILFHAGVNFALGTLGLISVTPDRHLLTILVALWGVAAVLVFLRLRAAPRPEPGPVEEANR